MSVHPTEFAMKRAHQIQHDLLPPLDKNIEEIESYIQNPDSGIPKLEANLEELQRYREILRSEMLVLEAAMETLPPEKIDPKEVQT